MNLTLTAINKTISIIVAGTTITLTSLSSTVILVQSPTVIHQYHSDLRTQERLTGIINGVNKVFTTTENFVAGSTKVFINGLRQELGVDYTETDDNEITFQDAPSNTGFTDVLLIEYLRS